MLKDKIYNFRSSFPIFKKNPQLVYFDTAATSLKPYKMINTMTDFYQNNGLNIRGTNPLNLQNEKTLERIRQKTASFVKAELEEIIFTKGATDSLNIIAQILYPLVNQKDEIIVSSLEHNSSFLPWLEVANQKKANLVFIPLDQHHQIKIDNFQTILSNKTKIVVLTHISNVLGHITPIKEITTLAHKQKALVVLDASQSVAHIPLDVKDLGIDFMAFSTHKAYGPFGLGVLFGKKKFLKKCKPPFVGGGSVKEVNIEKKNFIFNDLPYKWSPGTPNIGSIIAWEKSLEFMEDIGLNNIFKYENQITKQIFHKLIKIPRIKIFNSQITNIINFNFLNLNSHDVENFLSQDNIYVRTGHHCSHLSSNQIKATNTIRISVGIHNNEQDVDLLINSLKKVYNFFLK
ncbi:MAG: aminotransferase class V-fold PLP-dependent enzyme [Phytoplasma sp.]|uniref:aminotransferase class V-fold PLP-dependent enzyme n=1 Tax=Phytoplasma sp. TaxID=2155 RepID=UPI002B400518|nr:aminotransferase class V-fold PLP-dependent enzyme [Phytoplasma sp.]WRH06604.1 MAG: aminotransferase class V-fold PLP-dependent enzyme [Phytoplasma sp.]